MRVQGSWAMIMYLPGNDPSKAKYGWVSSSYFKVVNSGNRSRSTSSYGVSGDDCEYEYDSNAQVCVTATDAEMDCRESHDGTHYRSCEIEVEYSVSSDYEGDDYLDVECEVEIKYKKRDGYSWSYDSDSESENHSLYSYGSESGDMDFDFTFNSYKEVINVKIDSVECEINSVYKY